MMSRDELMDRLCWVAVVILLAVTAYLIWS